MWQHKVISNSWTDEKGARVDVEFSDGTTIFNKSYFPQHIESLKKLIKNDIDSFESRKDVRDSITLGVLDLTPLPVVPQTTEEIKQKKYNDKREELLLAKQDLDLGIINQSTYDVILSQLLSMT